MVASRSRPEGCLEQLLDHRSATERERHRGGAGYGEGEVESLSLLVTQDPRVSSNVEKDSWVTHSPGRINFLAHHSS